jgi:hypothetical protein
MRILVAEVASSSSTRRLKRYRRYVNRDRETTHFRLRYNYFDDNCVYPRHTSTDVPYAEDSFSKHYV